MSRIDVHDELDMLGRYRKAIKKLEAWNRFGPTPFENEESSYLNPMLEYAEGRCFFSTRDGRIGLGPWNMQEGDRLCVFFFCPTPYIIRPAGPDRWTFVGEAYVHGLMFGQALKILERGELVETSWILQ